MWMKEDSGINGMCTSQLDLSDRISSAPNRTHMKTLFAQEVDVSTTCWTTERGGESVVTMLKQLCFF